MEPHLFDIVGNYLMVIVPALLVLLGLLVLYYTFMIRAVIKMLKHNVSSVLLVFTFLSLVPFPLTVILGIMILIIWHFHKKDIGVE